MRRWQYVTTWVLNIMRKDQERDESSGRKFEKPYRVPNWKDIIQF